MSRAERSEEPVIEGIDLDRVIIDPDYRRRVMNRLRAEAAMRPPSTDPAPALASGHDD